MKITRPHWTYTRKEFDQLIDEAFLKGYCTGGLFIGFCAFLMHAQGVF